MLINGHFMFYRLSKNNYNIRVQDIKISEYKNFYQNLELAQKYPPLSEVVKLKQFLQNISQSRLNPS
jgi:hypothetical protein